MEVVRFTPSKEELLPEREFTCTYPGCGSSFTNIGNMNMHVKRHHGNEPIKRYNPNGKECAFHCPQLECIYHETHAARKHFTTFKYLRQHYHKMHLSKMNVCDRCGKGFISKYQLVVHMEKMCGVQYICKECGWPYNTMEALLTHGKRKGHVVRDASESGSKKHAQRKRQAKNIQVGNNDQETQTEGVSPAKCVTKVSVLPEIINGRNAVSGPPTDLLEPRNQGTQTDDVSSSTCVSKSKCICAQNIIKTETSNGKNVSVSTNTQLPLDLLEPRHIETQTDDQMINLLRHTTFNTTTAIMHTSSQSSQLLPPSIHTYTQTYDDLFTDSLLGFTDIQTQTNWSSFSDDAVTTAGDASTQQYNASGVGACTRCAYDELLVSTETQTSFTQCLLESRTTNDDTDDGTFNNLYQTQHTQTCDMLLGALFGSQESDLIGGYQSTHTQT